MQDKLYESRPGRFMDELGKNAKHLLRAQTQTYNGAHADTLKTYKVLRTHKHARVAHKHRCAVLTGAHTLEDGARARAR